MIVFSRIQRYLAVKGYEWSKTQNICPERERERSEIWFNIFFLQQIYPDEGHFLSERSRQHLYSTLITYFRECLKEDTLLLPEEPEEEE